MAVHDGVTAAEPRSEPIASPGYRARIVDDADEEPFGVDHGASRQPRDERGFVDVPVHSRHGCDPLEPVEHRRSAEVTCVDDQARPAERLDARIR